MTSSENNRVFVWKDFSEWKPALEGMFPDILTPELEAKIKQNATLVEYCDDAGAFEKLSGRSIDSIITVGKIEEFRQRYSHIRVYHACRTPNVQSYYEKGILLLSKDEQIERFWTVFPHAEYPKLTEEMLQHSIREVESLKKNAEGDLCLDVDNRALIKQYGHYLIYGCEYFGNLVSQLPTDSKPYRSKLRTIGKPTLIEINLPNTTEYVTDCKLGELIRNMITYGVYNVAHPKRQSSPLMFTFPISKRLPPGHICGHYHPKKITDNLMELRIYNTETGEYVDHGE